jgi:hypothetical protein
VNDTGYASVFQADLATLDALTPIGGLCVSPHEVPSASLNVAVAAGNFRNSWGAVVTYAGAASQAIAASSTVYLWLTNAGVLASGSAWPSGFYVPLAVVVSGAGTITNIADARVVCGTANNQAQPTMGAATAGASYTTNEQAMLQAVYNAVRALGLGT